MECFLRFAMYPYPFNITAQNPRDPAHLLLKKHIKPKKPWTYPPSNLQHYPLKIGTFQNEERVVSQPSFFQGQTRS